MKIITTVTYEFDPGDRVIYTGLAKHPGVAGTIVGSDTYDWLVRWDGTDDIDDIAKGDLRPVEQLAALQAKL